MVHLEGRDHVDDDYQHDGRSQQRNRDPEEDPQRLGTVDLGCRVIERVDVLQTRQQQDDGIRQNRPDTEDDQGDEVARCIAQELNRFNAHQGQDIVDDAELVVEHESPGKTDCQ